MKMRGFSRALIVCVALAMGAASYAVPATAQAGKQVLWNDFNGPDMCLNSWRANIGNTGLVINNAKMVGCINASGQYWSTVPAGNDRYYMKTEFHGSSVCLTAIETVGSVMMHPCANKPGQRWYPQLVLGKSGGYRLHNDLFGKSKCFSVENSGNYEHTLMEPCSQFDGQIWHTRTQ